MPQIPLAGTRPLALLAACLLVAGCDADESLLGEFQGQIDVDRSQRLVEGEAVYTIVDGPRGPEFVLGLFVGDLFESDFEDYDYVLFRRPGLRPGVGAYAVDDDPTYAVAATIARVREADDPLEARGEVLRGLDGTLALTRIDDYGFVAGTFQFDAAGFLVQRPSRTVSGGASGTFEARYETPATFRALGLDLGI